MSKQATRYQWHGQPTSEMVQSYQDEGYLLVENFASPQECDALLARTKHLIDDFDPQAHRVIFSADGQSHAATDYFMKSASNISFFFEKGAMDDDGNMQKDKHLAVNKVGHALHDKDKIFHDFSRQPKIEALAKATGFEDPKLLQSMVICKAT